MPGKDPYFTHYYRINFDGTGLTALTDANANHTVTFSTDMKYYVDTWSRVDRGADVRASAYGGSESSRAKSSEATSRPLLDAGWHAPEVFSAIGRDGKTDIWGII